MLLASGHAGGTPRSSMADFEGDGCPGVGRRRTRTRTEARGRESAARRLYISAQRPNGERRSRARARPGCDPGGEARSRTARTVRAARRTAAPGRKATKVLLLREMGESVSEYASAAVGSVSRGTPPVCRRRYDSAAAGDVILSAAASGGQAKRGTRAGLEEAPSPDVGSARSSAAGWLSRSSGASTAARGAPVPRMLIVRPEGAETPCAPAIGANFDHAPALPGEAGWRRTHDEARYRDGKVERACLPPSAGPLRSFVDSVSEEAPRQPGRRRPIQGAWLHLGVALHPGAERYYREEGWLK